MPYIAWRAAIWIILWQGRKRTHKRHIQCIQQTSHFIVRYQRKKNQNKIYQIKNERLLMKINEAALNWSAITCWNLNSCNNNTKTINWSHDAIRDMKFGSYCSLAKALNQNQRKLSIMFCRAPTHRPTDPPTYQTMHENSDVNICEYQTFSVGVTLNVWLVWTDDTFVWWNMSVLLCLFRFKVFILHVCHLKWKKSNLKPWTIDVSIKCVWFQNEKKFP